jgi:replicative DNA helicase
VNVPPHNRDAERAVLGGILRDPDTLSTAQQIIRADNFYFDHHQKIFQSLSDLESEHQPLDLVLLRDRLLKNKQLEDIGGVEYLTELWECVPTGANCEYHAKLIRDAAMIRGVIHAGNRILRDAYEPVQSADDLVAQAEQAIFAISNSAAPVSGSVRWGSELAKAALARIDDRAARDGVFDGVATGFCEIDAYLSGLRPGEMIVIGARPGAGKTALGLGIAVNAADEDVPTLFASVEMGEAEIMDRVLSVRSKVPLIAIRRGRLDEAQASKLNAAGAWVQQHPFYLDTCPDLTPSGFSATLRRAVRLWKVRLAVVDYLQLLRPDRANANRTVEVDTISRSIKHTARACGVPIVVLCQVNREFEKRPGGKPRLSDIREAGGIEADASAVLFLTPKPDQPADQPEQLIDVTIAKNRNGPTGEVTLKYRRPYTRFEDASA